MKTHPSPHINKQKVGTKLTIKNKQKLGTQADKQKAKQKQKHNRKGAVAFIDLFVLHAYVMPNIQWHRG